MRLRFSVRTLFVVVTSVALIAAAAAYVARARQIVQERKAIRKLAIMYMTYRKYPLPTDRDPAINSIRYLLGDEAVRLLVVPINVSQRKLDLLEEAFPEASICFPDGSTIRDRDD